MNVRSGRCVLELLQGTCLDANRSWLWIEPAINTGERVLAEALFLGSDLLHANLQQTWQCEFASALLVDRTEDGCFESSQNCLGSLRFNTGSGGEISRQRSLGETFLDGLDRCRCSGSFRCCCLFHSCFCGCFCRCLFRSCRRRSCLLCHRGFYCFLCRCHKSPI